MMKKIKSFLLGCLLFSSPLQASALLSHSLTEIVRPYLGIYECRQMLLDGEDKLNEFEYIKLELKSGGEIVLSFLDKQGKKGKTNAEYEYDEKAQPITIRKNIGNQILKRSFPLKNGEVLVHLIYETRTIVMKFEQI